MINKSENLDPKTGGHNREPSEQSYYCGSGVIHGIFMLVVFSPLEFSFYFC